jgi:ParB-like nuclease family protein
MTNYPPEHPAAALLPMLPPDQLDQLAADIRANGLREAIVVHEGQVLDGRNRLAACKLAEVEPHYREFDGDDPIAYVLSANVHRRHLTTGQRAMVAVAMLPELEARARGRQGVRTDLRAGSPGSQNGHRARDEAARLVGASPRSVGDAKRLATEAPELAAEVRAGARSLNDAMSQLTGGRTHQTRALLNERQQLEAEARYITEKLDEHRAAMAVVNSNLGLMLGYGWWPGKEDGLDFRSAVYAKFGEAEFAKLLLLAQIGKDAAAEGEAGIGLAPWIARELVYGQNHQNGGSR